MQAPRSQRNLHHSPTAATLGHQSSTVALDTVPPLVSINDQCDSKANLKSGYGLQVKRREAISRGVETKNTNIKMEQYLKSRREKSNLNKKHPIIFSPASKHHYAYNKKQGTLLQGEQLSRQQQSMAESVYLDLEEYSSIHKYESISPHNQEFDEDQVYAQYFNTSRRNPTRIGITSQIVHSPVDDNQNLVGIRNKQNPYIDLNDTYAQFLIEQSENPDTIKVRRTLSTANQHNQKLSSIHRQTSLQIQDRKTMIQFQQIQQQAIEASQANRLKQFYNLTNQIYYSLFSPQQFNLYQHQISLKSNFEQQTCKITPTWFLNSSSFTNLRMILTKPRKLQEYCKYINQLQLLFIQKSQQSNIQNIKNRKDTLQSDQIALSNPIVHYQKIDYEQHPTPHKFGPVISNLGIQPKVQQKMHQGSRSQAGKFSQSQNVSKFSHSLSLKQEEKSSKYHEFSKKSKLATLHESSSDIERGSEQLNKPSKIIRKLINSNTRYSEQQILGVLQALVSKLSTKKCKVLIDQYQNQTQNKEGVQSIWGLSQVRRHQALSDQHKIRLRGGVKQSRTRIPNIVIQFDEIQVENNSLANQPLSAKLEANKLRKKQLEHILDMKQRQIEQVKSEYDYVINNYVATIANLKNIKQKDYDLATPVLNDDAQQRKKKEQHQNYRLSQPITFQMSKQGNQSYQDIDQWIGNPPSELQENKQLAYLRRSLPEKN